MDHEELKKIRDEIDVTNQSLISLFERRMELVNRVAEYKRERGLPVFDGAREKEVLEKCAAWVKAPHYRESCLWMMARVIEASRRYENKKIAEQKEAEPRVTAASAPCRRVGYQGVPGSYSHQALRSYFAGRDVSERNFKLFGDVVSAVMSGEVDCGVLPIENSSTGGILEVYDLLRKNDCHIVGEKIVKVDHNLMAVRGANMADIRRVYSHPQGFSQCAEFFAQHRDWELIPYFNTAKSAEMVALEGDLSKAAVASREAAELYGLEILAPNINSSASNYTRFVVIAAAAQRDEEADKITVVIGLRHEPGALCRALSCFCGNGLNLTNIESRPLEGGSWEYFFHLDFSGHLREKNVERAVAELEKNTSYLKILGNYRANRAG